MSRFQRSLNIQHCRSKPTGINHKRLVVFRIWLTVFFLLLTSCTTVPYRRGPLSFSPSHYITIENFCKKNNLGYNFNTIDDIVNIFSSREDIYLLLNSPVGYFKGRIIYLNRPPLYKGGEIFLPKELEEIVSSGKIISLPPAFIIKKVVIDPGHGGRDPGAISPRGIQEKNLNLKVAKYLKRELEQRGMEVILTRSGDTYLTLKERVEIAKRCNADIFLSIHSNSNRAAYIKGIEIYYLSPYNFRPQERAVKLVKDRMFKGTPSDARVILWDLLLTKNYALSMDIAHSLHLTFKNLGLKVSPPHKANFYVLRLAYVPSILVEIGYLSNRGEERILRKKYYQKQLAEAIALGVISLNKRYTKLAKDAN